MKGRKDSRSIALCRIGLYGLLRDDDLTACLQLIEAACGHHFAWIESRDRGLAPSVTVGLMVRMLATRWRRRRRRPRFHWCWTAPLGITVAALERIQQQPCIDRNWLGKSSPLAFSNCARRFTVPWWY